MKYIKPINEFIGFRYPGMKPTETFKVTFFCLDLETEEVEPEEVEPGVEEEDSADVEFTTITEDKIRDVLDTFAKDHNQNIEYDDIVIKPIDEDELPNNGQAPKEEGEEGNQADNKPDNLEAPSISVSFDLHIYNKRYLKSIIDELLDMFYSMYNIEVVNYKFLKKYK